METKVATPPAEARRRWPLFLIGVLFFVLGPVIFAIELNLHHLETPWQAPILATIGGVLIAVSTWQRRGVWRCIGCVFFLLLCAGEWFMVGVAVKLPAYTGPAQIDTKLPAFITARADGAPFSNRDLANGQPTVLVFYRGHW